MPTNLITVSFMPQAIKKQHPTAERRRADTHEWGCIRASGVEFLAGSSPQSGNPVDGHGWHIPKKFPWADLNQICELHTKNFDFEDPVTVWCYNRRSFLSLCRTHQQWIDPSNTFRVCLAKASYRICAIELHCSLKIHQCTILYPGWHISHQLTTSAPENSP